MTKLILKHPIQFNSIQFIDHLYSPPLSKVHYPDNATPKPKRLFVTSKKKNMLNVVHEWDFEPRTFDVDTTQLTIVTQEL